MNMIEWVLIGGRRFPYFNNGVFLDGRDKTLSRYGMKLRPSSSSAPSVVVRRAPILVQNISVFLH